MSSPGQGDASRAVSADGIEHHLLDAVYRAEAPRLIRLLKRRVWAEDERHDIVQEAFTRLAETRSAAASLNPAAYLRGIVRHLLADRTRRWFRAQAVGSTEIRTCDEPLPPDAVAEINEMRERYRAAVDQLPPKTREVYVLQEVNDGLAHGRYFFMDVVRDGIALYQLDDSELHTPRPKSPDAALEMAEEYFEEWFPTAMQRFATAKFGIEQGYNKPAAFDLQQTTEFLYHCVLLVCTFYTPHVHNLNFLRNQAEKISGSLVPAWPRSTKADRARFEKLKDAYVKARYSKHYRISKDELNWLAEHIEALGQAVHELCQTRIAELRSRV
ncbi:MAG: HEPN domain-containing protein [Sphingobium sp.]|nr:HEPN domain-containing protein [Sphingobium sp.]